MLNLSAVNQKDYIEMSHLDIKFSIKITKKGQYKVIFQSLRYLARCKKLDPKPTVKSGELIANSAEELENIIETLHINSVTLVEVKTN